jgi:MoxR-like ATPase
VRTADTRSTDLEEATSIAARLVDNVGKALEGKREVVELAVIALLARGHALVEDVPGVGKTTLARALARSMGVEFRRLQFTSDLMPADVLGGNVFDQGSGTFSFRAGPVFTNVLLADEINRTTPKTQSALLEAMGERQVSIEGETHGLPEPFFVVATQNPEDFYGTYPLPESQLDRFLIRLRIGYPPAEVERRVIQNRRSEDPVEKLESVVTLQQLLGAQAAVDEVRVDEVLVQYLHELVVRSRESSMLALGASTRAALSLERAARARALTEGRGYALPDDIQALAEPVLAHRVRMAGAADGASGRQDAERVIRDLLGSVAVPV